MRKFAALLAVFAAAVSIGVGAASAAPGHGHVGPMKPTPFSFSDGR